MSEFDQDFVQSVFHFWLCSRTEVLPLQSSRKTQLQLEACEVKFDAEMIESGLLKREEVKSRTNKTHQPCSLANLPKQQQKICDFVRTGKMISSQDEQSQGGSAAVLPFTTCLCADHCGPIDLSRGFPWFSLLAIRWYTWLDLNAMHQNVLVVRQRKWLEGLKAVTSWQRQNRVVLLDW